MHTQQQIVEAGDPSPIGRGFRVECRDGSLQRIARVPRTGIEDDIQ